MPELLLPAGNFEKMTAALRFGADAVYLAGTMFGMRASAANFTVEELYAAAKYVHARRKRLYLTLNTMPRVDEYPRLERYLDEIADANLDAFIVADGGVLETVRARIPHAEIHISTQQSVVSDRTCRFWQKQGAKRIVLARETSLAEIREIRARIPRELELEAFVHGSMCISYSGRCLLSQYLTGRDANRGACTQPCRWNFSLVEEKRPNTPLPIEADADGTFILSGKDMCMLEHIPELMESGIDSFKIEGRMKSAYYTAVTANAYRIAIDRYLADPAAYTFAPEWMREVESVSHREYGTGFYFDRPADDANLCSHTGYLREKAFLAVAEGYDSATGIATFVQRNKCSAGETVELLTPGSVGRAFVLTAMTDENGTPIPSAPHPSMRFSVPTPFPVAAGDILRGV